MTARKTTRTDTRKEIARADPMTLLNPFRGGDSFGSSFGERTSSAQARNPLSSALLQGAHLFLLFWVLAIAGFGVLILYSVAAGLGNLGQKPKPCGFCLGWGLPWWWLRCLCGFGTALAWAGWFLGVGLLLATEWFGVTVNQATRWLPLFGSLQIQPSELMRIALIVVLARWFSGFRHGEISRKPWLLLPPLLLIAIPVLLVLRQPDLGTGLILAVLGISIIFMAGLHWGYFVVAACGVFASMPLLWAQLHEYQQRRVLTFLNPEDDPLGSGYHILQSKIALGSGGISGKGFLGGTQAQLDFLPEKHTDFIFTTLAEEFGLIGGATLIGFYLFFFVALLLIAVRCRNFFSKVLVSGLCLNIASYVFINIGMVSGLLPVVGVPLPLLSFGGTVTLAVFLSLGLVISASQARDESFETNRRPLSKLGF